jgi:hypothetical protein
MLLKIIVLFFLIAGCAPTAPKQQTEPPQVLPQFPDDNDPSCLQGKTVGFSGPVAELLQDKCASCHPSYNDYESVSSPAYGNQIVSRVFLPSNDVRRMPKFPANELSFAEKKLLRDWQTDGFQLEGTCKDPGNLNDQAWLDLNAIERYILADLDSIESDNGQANARYLVMTHRSDANVAKETFVNWVKGLNKTVNTLSSNQNLVKVTPIDPSETIYRFELATYGLTSADWNLILGKDVYKFESRTRRGLEIQRRTRTQFPWLHADNFSFISLGDPAVYNQLTRVQSTLAQEQARFGVNQSQQFANFEARLIGFNGSPISENKNRLLLRLSADNNESSFWQTFDPNSQFSAQKNLFDFPLVQVGERRFVFDASETIGFLDNGMMIFGLWNSQGQRQTEAPIDVVVNNRSPFSAIIKNGLDCLRCHSSGLLNAVDQVKAQVNANASEFARNDVDLVNAFYRNAATNSALFINDNKRYQDGLRKLGIDPLGEDPVNQFLDDYRADLSLVKAASFLFMTPQDFCAALQGSAQGKAQIGQLCTTPPGTVTLVQWQNTFPILKRDFRLGLDPLDN